MRVESCGICHTDLKKIEYDLLPPPRVYGHETAGVVVRAGEQARNFAPGDRVCLFHHVPCLDCFYCKRGNYAQCATYKRVGVTAGFEPAGGGFAQYVKVMDWIARRGVVKIPDGISFDRASFVEPVNTCLKALTLCDPSPEETVLVMGQGPIGLLFTMLLRQAGVEHLFATDVLKPRMDASRRMGAEGVLEPVGSRHLRGGGEQDRRPRRGRRDRCRVGASHRRTGGRGLAARGTGDAVCPDLAAGDFRVGRCGDLRPRADAVGFL